MLTTLLICTLLASAAYPPQTELFGAAMQLLSMSFSARARLILNLKGCEIDGVKVGVMETFLPRDTYRGVTEEVLTQPGLPVYLDYMARLFHIQEAPRAAAVGSAEAEAPETVSLAWHVTPMERLLTAIAALPQLKIVENGHQRYRSIGGAKSGDIISLVDAVSAAKALTEELIFTRKANNVAFAELQKIARREGEAFCRLAFLIEAFAFKVTSHQYKSPALAEEISRSAKDYFRGADNLVSLVHMLPWINREGDRPPNKLSHLMAAVWDYRQESPVLLGLPEDLLLDFLAKTRVVLRVETTAASLDAMSGAFTRLFPALRGLAEEPGNINEDPRWYGRDFWDLTPHPDDAFGGLPLEEISEHYRARAVDTSFRGVLARNRRVDLMGRSQQEVLSSLVKDTKSVGLVEALLEADDLEIGTLVAMSPLFETDLVSILESLALKFPGESAKLRFLISSGFHLSAVSLLHRVSGKIGLQTVAKVVDHLSCGERAEVGGVEIFKDPEEQAAFAEFASSLARLRRRHPAKRLNEFVFPGFADLALFVAAGEGALALDKIHGMKLKGGFNWKPVESLVKEYALFGKYFSLVRRHFPALVDQSRFEKMLHAGEAGEVLKEFMWLVERPQVVKSVALCTGEECIEDDEVHAYPDVSSVDVSPGLSDKVASMTRHVLGKWHRLLMIADDLRVWEHPDMAGEYDFDLIAPILAKRASFWLYLLFNPERARRVRELVEECLDEVPDEMRYIALVCSGLSYHRRRFPRKAAHLDQVELNNFVEGYKRSNMAQGSAIQRRVEAVAAPASHVTPVSVASLQDSLLSISFADV